MLRLAQLDAGPRLNRPNLIHFDAREGHVEDVIEHHRAVREHVARGGYLGWGLWPTDVWQRGPFPFDSRDMQYFLAHKARDLSFVDASVGLIFKRSMLTGVCGGAGLDATTERRVAADLEALSMGIRRRYWIAETTDLDPDSRPRNPPNDSEPCRPPGDPNLGIPPLASPSRRPLQKTRFPSPPLAGGDVTE